MLTITQLNHLRNPKSLAALKKVFTDFLGLQRADAIKVYASFGWGEEDLDDDVELVNEWIERIDRRAKSLSGYLARADKNVQPKLSLPETSSEPTDVDS